MTLHVRAPAAARPRFLAVLLPILALSGCGGDDAASDPSAQVVVDTVAGVERLTYPPGAGDALGWSVDTVGVIGEAMGAEEYSFGTLGDDDLAGLPDGGVVVVDREGARVLEYGPDGRHRATYGRRGGGPGELSFAAGVAIGPGDTIWVNDVMNRRLTGYPRDDGEPRGVPYARSDVFPGSRIAALDDGFMQVIGAVSQDGGPVAEPLVRTDADLTPVDTLREPPPQQMDLVRIDLVTQEFVMGMPQQFWPALQWRTLSDGGVIVADSADYVLRIFGPAGELRRLVIREPARATTEADREEVRRRVFAEAEDGGGIQIGGGPPNPSLARRIAEQRVEQMTFAEWVPRIVELQVDPSDRIWVGVSEDTPEEVERIDIYDPDGRLLGELRGFPFPAAFAGPDRVLTVRTDELDVPQVVILALEDDGG
jgi:hypothetical protein